MNPCPDDSGFEFDKLDRLIGLFREAAACYDTGKGGVLEVLRDIQNLTGNRKKYIREFINYLREITDGVQFCSPGQKRKFLRRALQWFLEPDSSENFND